MSAGDLGTWIDRLSSDPRDEPEPAGAAWAEATAAAREDAAQALKDAQLACWNRDPARVPAFASCLQRLADHGSTPRVDALCAWTRGMAHLVDGALVDAVAAFDMARDGLDGIGRVQEAAQTQVPKLIALSLLGRHDEARACAEATLQRFVHAGDDRSAGKVELNLASMLLRQEQYAAAAGHYRRVAVRFARLSDVEHSVMADIGLATAWSWLHRFDDARAMLQRARQRAAAHGLPVLEALARGNLGQLELHGGRVAAALRELEASARALATLGSPPRQVEAERALADAYVTLNLAPEALALCRAVVDTARRVGAPVEQARALVEMARAHVALDEREAAAQALDDARRLFEAQGNAVGVALARWRRAVLVLPTLAAFRARPFGGPADDGPASAAVSACQAAADTLRDAGVVGWQREAEFDAWRALAVGVADPEDGQRVLSGLAGLRDQAQGDGLPALAAACDGWLGALHERLGDLAAAAVAHRAAVAHHDRWRQALPDDDLRVRQQHDAQASYDALVALAARAGGVGSAPADARALLLAMEHGRARAQGLARPAAGGRLRAWADPTVRSMRMRLTWLEHQWRQAVDEPDEQARAAALAGEARAVELALLEHVRRHCAAGYDAGRDAAQAPASADAPIDVDRLIGAVPAGVALVAYHVDGPVWRACVVRGDGITAHEGDARGLAEDITQVRFQCDAFRYGASALQAHLPLLVERLRRRMQSLHRRLVAPLAPRLAGCRRIVVVPHGPLHDLPFAALHDGEGWWVERHDLVLAPSAAAWLDAPSPGLAAQGQVLVVGHGPSLAHVERETAAVAACWPGRARVLAGDAASVAAVLAAAPDAGLLHFACHARYRADNPAFSSLALADGPLTMGDVATLSLAAPLVVLGACETAGGRLLAGGDVIGLVRGFLVAGASSVVATMWAVDDAATADLMTSLHAHLRDGADPAAALSAAQRALAYAGAHPHAWAALAVHGAG